MKKRLIASIAGVLIALSGTVSAQTPLRFLSQALPSTKQFPLETEAIERLNKDPEASVAITRSEFSALGLNTADALRYLRGTFDVVSIPLGIASRDDAFLEGIDLVGVSTNLPHLKTAVDAYRQVFEQRIESRFAAKVVALWPFGVQSFFCNRPIRSVADLKGMKIRTYSASLSLLIQKLGAVPVSLSYTEVYPALQRGVVECGVSSPTSGNVGKWPEVTTHFLPLSVAGGMNVYVVSNAFWEKLSPTQRTALTREFARLEAGLWALAATTNEDAATCNVGGDACKEHTKYKMASVPVAAADLDLVKSAVEGSVLSEWGERCERQYPRCRQTWNQTVGTARGFRIQ